MKKLTEDRLIQLHTEAQERLYLANGFERETPPTFTFDTERIIARNYMLAGRKESDWILDLEREVA